jgi:hypothetical protein
MRRAVDVGVRTRNRAVALAVLLAIALALVLVSCNPTQTLSSLRKLDDHPLYVMHYYGQYSSELLLRTGTEDVLYGMFRDFVLPDACTCFVGLSSEGDTVFGRNFDWHDHPALLLFTDPPNGYASVSMVDIHYLGFDAGEPPETGAISLLLAPFLPFDGLNEAGVAVGLMAVPRARDSEDPQKPSIDSLRAIRVVLDRAGSTEEAISLLQDYNILFYDPPVHYLIADSSGDSAVVEYVDGELQVLRNDLPWQVATNFIVSEILPEGADSPCSRYNGAYRALSVAGGSVSPDEAMAILEDVSGANTIWSAVYDMTTGDIQIVMGKQYDQVHTFELPMHRAATR